MAPRAAHDASWPSTAPSFITWLCRGQPLVVALCLAFVVLDVIFMGLHVVAAFRWPGNRLLYIDVDRSYAEAFQAMKYVIVAVLLGCAAVVGRVRPLVLWIPVFLGFLVTDLLELHERGGGCIVELLPPGMWGERAQDVAELVVYLTGALALAAVVGVGYVRGSPLVRRVFRILSVLIGLLAVFGVVVDFLHSLFPRTSLGADALTMVEDGGEMLVVSLIVTVGARLVTALARPAASSADAR